ncbi:hypothetical protein ABIC83_002491 [Roseateles asaccharophilus]|uniref:hypothetical protein n=1 Tax=Roseateles asaccharophilus TaxID=582607 RepID=UPI003838DDB8
MSDLVQNCIRIVGTHESVAEVAMFLSQDHKIRLERVADVDASNISLGAKVEIGHQGTLLFSRYSALPLRARGAEGSANDAFNVEFTGLRHIERPDGSSYFELRCQCDTDAQPPYALAQAISGRFQDVVLGVESYQPSSNAWWHLTVSHGVVQAHLKPSLMPGHDGRTIDDQVSAWASERFEPFALDLLTKQAKSRLDSMTPDLVNLGWPRWSLVTHAAYDGGIQGLQAATQHFESGEEILKALQADADAAERRGVASWMDATLFGEAAAPPTGNQPPYLQLHAERHKHRLLEVLHYVSTAGADDAPLLATPLLASLSDPFARMSGGLHPVVYLAAAAQAAPKDVSARKGLDMVLERYAAAVPELREATTLHIPLSHSTSSTPQDACLRSALALASLPRVSEHQLKPAIRVGVPPQVLLWTVLASGSKDEHLLDPANLNKDVLDSLHDGYGTLSQLPTGLTHEIAVNCPGLQSAFEARVTAETMLQRIKDMPASEAVRRPRAHP